MATTEIERAIPEDADVRVLETVAGPEGEEFASPSMGGLKGLTKAAANWGELRRTPYGLKPAVMFAILNFFAIFDGQVFANRRP